MNRLFFKFPDPVGNGFGEDDGELHVAGVVVAVVPGGLDDELLLPLFLHRVDVGAGIREHVGEERPSRLRMAVQHVPADDFLPSGLEERPAGLSVHVQDGPVLGTDGHGDIYRFKIVALHGGWLFGAKIAKNNAPGNSGALWGCFMQGRVEPVDAVDRQDMGITPVLPEAICFCLYTCATRCIG